MANSLGNEVAAVTGAGRGIGRGIALSLAAAGAAVGIKYRLLPSLVTYSVLADVPKHGKVVDAWAAGDDQHNT